MATNRHPPAAQLRAVSFSTLVTTAPEFHGRSLGTNVMEGAWIAPAGKRPEEMRPEDYLHMLRRLGWRQRVAQLAEAAAPASHAPQPKEQTS
jgi:hypothetical protein